jgi:chromosome partitioning protein
MAAKIIAVVNQKGGSGKTTVSMQLAGTLGIKGHQVLVVDADPQGTATRWSATAPDDKPFPAAVMNLSAAGNKLHKEVQKYVDKFDYIIIDCPPAVETVIPQAALLIADLALVPLAPSLADIWATVGIKQIIESVANVNPALKSRLVINQLVSNTNLSRELLDVLANFGIAPVSTTLGSRTVYKESLAGVTVHDLGNRAEPAINEILKLTDEVIKLLA